MNKKNKKQSYQKLVLERHKEEKLKLFSEAKKPTLKVPMLQVNGVLMDPVEALRYLKLHLEAYQKAKKKAEEVSMVCPSCGSTPHL